MTFQQDSFYRAPRTFSQPEDTITAFDLHTSGLANGGRSLYDEHLELHRLEREAWLIEIGASEKPLDGVTRTVVPSTHGNSAAA